MGARTGNRLGIVGCILQIGGVVRLNISFCCVVFVFWIQRKGGVVRAQILGRNGHIIAADRAVFTDGCRVIIQYQIDRDTSANCGSVAIGVTIARIITSRA